MIGRLRQILPGWTIWVFAALFLVFEGPVLYWEWKIGRPIVELRVRPGNAIINLAACFYGIHRAVTLHPFFREDYRKWLELTPWTVYKPLPMGPIALIWEDGIVLGALILLRLTQPSHDSILTLTLFLLVHSAALTVSFWLTGAGTVGYLAAFGSGLAVRLLPAPWPCFAVTASVYLLVHEGLWQSLARFPWDLKWSLSDLNNMRALNEKTVGPSCGWPHDRFLRDVKAAERASVNRLDAISFSMLVGWWMYCVLSLIPSPIERTKIGTCALFIIVVITPITRLVTYIGLYHDPISLWGRIRTGRWIIPGYDIVLVGPALSFLTGVLGLVLCWAMQVPLGICPPFVVTAVILLAMVTPPRLKDWLLTGKHRIVPGQLPQGPNAEFIKVG